MSADTEDILLRYVQSNEDAVKQMAESTKKLSEGMLAHDVDNKKDHQIFLNTLKYGLWIVGFLVVAIVALVGVKLSLPHMGGG